MSMSQCQEVAFAGWQMSMMQACPCSGHTTQILSSYFSFDAATANSFSPSQLLQMSRQLIYCLACICRIVGKCIIRVIHGNPCVGVLRLSKRWCKISVPSGLHGTEPLLKMFHSYSALQFQTSLPDLWE